MFRNDIATLFLYSCWCAYLYVGYYDSNPRPSLCIAVRVLFQCDRFPPPFETPCRAFHVAHLFASQIA